MSADREILAEIHLNHPATPEQKVVCICTRIFLKWVRVLESLSDTKENLEREKNFSLSFFLSPSRNVFYIYASTLGTEETSEADDVFNEKAELHVFREKVKSSHENEVRRWRRMLLDGKSIFFIISPFRQLWIITRFACVVGWQWRK